MVVAEYGVVQAPPALGAAACDEATGATTAAATVRLRIAIAREVIFIAKG
jgi:hypothetical protein